MAYVLKPASALFWDRFEAVVTPRDSDRPLRVEFKITEREDGFRVVYIEGYVRFDGLMETRTCTLQTSTVQERECVNQLIMQAYRRAFEIFKASGTLSGLWGFGTPGEEVSVLVEAHPEEMVPEVKKGVQIIAEERQRHMDVRGWDSSHDDDPNHENGEMAAVAALYAVPHHGKYGINADLVERLYPKNWHVRWWNPGPAGSGVDGTIKDLAKAGALIAAEIDRLNRRYKKCIG